MSHFLATIDGVLQRRTAKKENERKAESLPHVPLQDIPHCSHFKEMVPTSSLR